MKMTLSLLVHVAVMATVVWVDPLADLGNLLPLRKQRLCLTQLACDLFRCKPLPTQGLCPLIHL